MTRMEACLQIFQRISIRWNNYCTTSILYITFEGVLHLLHSCHVEFRENKE